MADGRAEAEAAEAARTVDVAGVDGVNGASLAEVGEGRPNGSGGHAIAIGQGSVDALIRLRAEAGEAVRGHGRRALRALHVGDVEAEIGGKVGIGEVRRTQGLAEGSARSIGNGSGVGIGARAMAKAAAWHAGGT